MRHPDGPCTSAYALLLRTDECSVFAVDTLDAPGETLHPFKFCCAVCIQLMLVTQVRRTMDVHINTSMCSLERAMRCSKRHQVYPVHKADRQGSLASGRRRSGLHETSWHDKVPSVGSCTSFQHRARSSKSRGCLQESKQLASEAVAGA